MQEVWLHHARTHIHFTGGPRLGRCFPSQSLHLRLFMTRDHLNLNARKGVDIKLLHGQVSDTMTRMVVSCTHHLGVSKTGGTSNYRVSKLQDCRF